MRSVPTFLVVLGAALIGIGLIGLIDRIVQAFRRRAEGEGTDARGPDTDQN